jgi:hypothetical protein
MMSIATDEALGSISIGARTIGEKAELLYFFFGYACASIKFSLSLLFYREKEIKSI